MKALIAAAPDSPIAEGGPCDPDRTDRWRDGEDASRTEPAEPDFGAWTKAHDRDYWYRPALTSRSKGARYYALRGPEGWEVRVGSQRIGYVALVPMLPTPEVARTVADTIAHGHEWTVEGAATT